MNRGDYKHRSNVSSSNHRKRAQFSSSNSEIHKKGHNEKVKERQVNVRPFKKYDRYVEEWTKDRKVKVKKRDHNKEIMVKHVEHSVLHIENEDIESKRKEIHLRNKIASRSFENISSHLKKKKRNQNVSCKVYEEHHREDKYARGDNIHQKIKKIDDKIKENHANNTGPGPSMIKEWEPLLKTGVKKSKSQPWNSDKLLLKQKSPSDVKKRTSKRSLNFNCTVGKISIQGASPRQPYLNKILSEDCLNSQKKTNHTDKTVASDEVKVLFTRVDSTKTNANKSKKSIFRVRKNIRTTQQVHCACLQREKKDTKEDKLVELVPIENMKSVFYPAKCVLRDIWAKYPLKIPVPMCCQKKCAEKNNNLYVCERITKLQQFLKETKENCYKYLIRGPILITRYFLIGLLAIVWLPLLSISYLCAFLLDLVLRPKQSEKIRFRNMIINYVLGLWSQNRRTNGRAIACSRKKNSTGKVNARSSNVAIETKLSVKPNRPIKASLSKHSSTLGKYLKESPAKKDSQVKKAETTIFSDIKQSCAVYPQEVCVQMHRLATPYFPYSRPISNLSAYSERKHQKNYDRHRCHFHRHEGRGEGDARRYQDRSPHNARPYSDRTYRDGHRRHCDREHHDSRIRHEQRYRDRSYERHRHYDERKRDDRRKRESSHKRERRRCSECDSKKKYEERKRHLKPCGCDNSRKRRTKRTEESKRQLTKQKDKKVQHSQIFKPQSTQCWRSKVFSRKDLPEANKKKDQNGDGVLCMCIKQFMQRATESCDHHPPPRPPEKTVAFVEPEIRPVTPEVPVNKIVYHHHMQTRRVQFQPNHGKCAKRQCQGKKGHGNAGICRCLAAVQRRRVTPVTRIARKYKRAFCGLTSLERCVWGPLRCCKDFDECGHFRCKRHLCFWAVICSLYRTFLCCWLYIFAILIWLPIFAGAIILTRLICRGVNAGP